MKNATSFSKLLHYLSRYLSVFNACAVFFLCTGDHHWCAERRHASAVGDAVPAQVCAKGERRGAFLRQGRQLRTGIGLVQETDAVLFSQPDHH